MPGSAHSALITGSREVVTGMTKMSALRMTSWGWSTGMTSRSSFLLILSAKASRCSFVGLYTLASLT